jgi:hypothetical protein
MAWILAFHLHYLLLVFHIRTKYVYNGVWLVHKQYYTICFSCICLFLTLNFLHWLWGLVCCSIYVPKCHDLYANKSVHRGHGSLANIMVVVSGMNMCLLGVPSYGCGYGCGCGCVIKTDLYANGVSAEALALPPNNIMVDWLQPTRWICVFVPLLSSVGHAVWVLVW